jgi:flagellar hook-associated protein 1
MSLFSTLYVGHSGLAAARTGIDATAHNVANSLTPGYTRRGVDQSTMSPIRQGGLWIGQGVSTDAISRSTDNFLGMRRIETAAASQAAASFYDAMTGVEFFFDETDSTGPQGNLTAFFDALGATSADPSDASLRAEFARAGETLADSIRVTQIGLQESREGFAEQVGENIDGLNAVLGEVAVLNEAILAAGGAISAGDLADQRDLLLRQLGEEAGFTASIEADGTATVFIGGHAAVDGDQARTLSFDESSGAPEVHLSVGATTVNVTSELGGRMEGLTDAYDAVESYLADLDTLASTLATELNTVHAGGFDLSGAPGGDLFTFDPLDPAASLRFSEPIAADPGLLALATDPLGLPGDASNLALMLDVEDATLFAGGTMTARDFLSEITNRLAGEVASAESNRDRQLAVSADLDELADNLYGVDLDEEAANLIMYQASYQAAAKVIQAADETLRVLMELA